MIYLYAITELSAQIPSESGFDDTPLQIASSARVAALFSTHQSLELSSKPDLLLHHEQVVEAAMRQGATLPARFGTTFAGEGALRSTVERAGDHLRRQLRRVRGCVELAVRVGLPESPHSDPRDGRGYLEAKLADRRELEEISVATLTPLARLAVRARNYQGRSEGNVLRASYLVREDQVERFAAEVRLLADRHQELWLSCTGPWPPYSFADLKDAR